MHASRYTDAMIAYAGLLLVAQFGLAQTDGSVSPGAVGTLGAGAVCFLFAARRLRRPAASNGPDRIRKRTVALAGVCLLLTVITAGLAALLLG